MPIVCPHCATSYAVDPAALGAGGRMVRCSRCRETWLAQPEDARVVRAAGTAIGNANADVAAEWEAMANTDLANTDLANKDLAQHDLAPAVASHDDWAASGTEARDGGAFDAPVIDSPSISADWPDDLDMEDSAVENRETRRSVSWLQRWRNPFRRRPSGEWAGRRLVSLNNGCVVMAAVVIALVFWRTDMVRLLPQTAGFYKMIGLQVNLRGLALRDIEVGSEIVEGKPVLVISGAIASMARSPVTLPRLRFTVLDAQGSEIYAWNTALKQPALNPGERTIFTSRLAAPPPEGRNIDIRFFNRQDLSRGGV